jgi:hypothetical protein
LLYSTAILFATLTGASAFAQGTCRTDWTVKAEKQGTFLNIAIRESTQQGPACDLVVKSFDYFEVENVKALSLGISPVKFCPLDAVTRRSANLQWQIPFHARNNSDLRLIVNGNDIGRLTVNQGRIDFERTCQ